VNLKRPIPDWGKEVKKALIDRDMDIKALANEIGFCREYVSLCINGQKKSDDLKKKICDYLNVACE